MQSVLALAARHGQIVHQQIEEPFGTPRRYLASYAVLDPEMNYRYALWREWKEGRPTAVWVMLNPSTADGNADDPTIRRCVEFSKVYGMGSILVLNGYALRSKSPRVLRTHADPIGPLNDTYLHTVFLSLAAHGGLPIVAWGNHLPEERAIAINRLSYGLWCLGVNKNGSPKHPLYVPGATALSRWPEVSGDAEADDATEGQEAP